MSEPVPISLKILPRASLSQNVIWRTYRPKVDDGGFVGGSGLLDTEMSRLSVKSVTSTIVLVAVLR